MPTPNKIKYSNESSQIDSLKKGDFYLGVSDINYGPSEQTGFYAGVTSSNYVTYVGNESDINYNISNNDSDLIEFLSNKAGFNLDNIENALNWSSTQSNIIVTNFNHDPIVTDGLVLNLDAGFIPSYPRTDNNWNDISFNENNATLINGPVFSYNGNGIIFDGVDDSVNSDFKASEIIGNGNPFSISVFFKANVIGQQMLVCCPDSPRFYVETFNRSGTFVCHWGIGQNNNSTTSTAIINTEQIYNYVVTYDGNIAKGYLDGVIKDTDTIGSQNYNSNSLRIGKYTDGFPLYLKGNIYQTQIYNRALSESEILQNYNSNKDRYAFTSTWRTSNTSTGSSTSTQVSLPLISTGTYNMLVDWGDGTQDTITSWDQAQKTHTYATAGDYTIKIYGICRGWYFNNTGDRLKILNISRWGSLDLSVGRAFMGCVNLDSTATDAPIISATNMEYTFQSCSNFNGYVNNWNMSNVTGMRQFFTSCTKFNQPLDRWDVSKVTIMGGMFSTCTVFNQDLSNWNVSSCTIFGPISGVATSGMFQSALAFNNGGSPGINNWQIRSNADVSMQSMFNSATSFNQPIGDWNMSRVNNVANMFNSAIAFNNGGDPNINNWNVTNITNMTQFFRNARSFNQNIGGWDISNVTTIASMFRVAQSFNNGGSPDINNWNTSNVTNMLSTFNNAINFNQNIGAWDVSKVTVFCTGATFESIFNSAIRFNNGGSSDINNWRFSTTTDISFNQFFRGCTDFNQPIGDWNTDRVNDFSNMFQSAINFNQNIGSWNVTKSTSFSSMFISASSFNNGGSSDINNWIINTTQNVSMSFMFNAATSFQQPIGNWNTSRVTSMQNMFSLKNYNQDITTWDTSNVTIMRAMFRANSTFNQNISTWDVSKVTDFGGGASFDAMFSQATSFNQNLGSWNLRSAGTTLTQIFSFSGMSCQNYTDTIVGWANNTQLNDGPFNTSMTSQTGRRFDGTRSGGSGFDTAAEARTYLTTATPTGAGWSISGDTLGAC